MRSPLQQGAQQGGEPRLRPLLESCARGDVGALAALIDTTAAASLAVARCVTGDEERAERATHDAYVEIWHRATQHRLPDQDVATWVLAVTHRHARALAA